MSTSFTAITPGARSSVGPFEGFPVQTAFELYRRNQQEVEILTYDELLARAQYIVRTTEADDRDKLP